jgi:hypothetical protein
VNYKIWSKSNFRSPSPSFVKHAVLSRYPTDIWIETGTYQGETTKLLSTLSREVTTIEAQEIFYENNKIKFANNSNIQALFGKSADLLETIVENYVKKGTTNINLFLDAHYSGGRTYGELKEPPVLAELSIISKFLPNLKNVYIFIDDFRLFGDFFDSSFTNSDSAFYPTKNYLVEFATSNNMSWDIDQDMFILKKSN